MHGLFGREIWDSFSDQFKSELHINLGDHRIKSRETQDFVADVRVIDRQGRV